MKIEIQRITDSDLWSECAEMTSGKPCGYMQSWEYPTERKKFELMFNTTTK